MRNRRRILGALAFLFFAAPAANAAPVGPGASDGPSLPSRSGLSRLHRPPVPLPWGDNLTIDRIGYVTRGGTVTLYGTYRCVRDGMDFPRANILVTLTQEGEDHGIGGEAAICDGQRRRWQVEGVGAARYERGPAYAEATLVKFENVNDYVPVPRIAADAEREVRLASPED
ncbi:DUF6299 family protein [Streptomyces sp. NPDC005322]|uniref:DUF6299 family protein n=1 Tax=unclassified Streptomyces TaxID=2593676 RepID=UPI0033BC635B